MELRDFQQDAAEIMDKRFRGQTEDRKRFVGAILPTGGGKSFLFMDQLEKEMIDFNATENFSKEVPLSKVYVKFFAPLKGIIEQTVGNISEYIILPSYIKAYTDNGEIQVTQENVQEIFDSILNRIISSAKITEKAKTEFLNNIEDITISKDDSPEESLKDALLKVLDMIPDKKMTKLLETELPNVKLKCYQDDKELEVRDGEDWDKTTLVCFDEAHKTGAKTWSQKVKEMMENDLLQNCNFMAITATPERDVDGVDALDILAENCGQYSTEEIRKKDYLACNITLVEALEAGIVVKPRVQSFDCMLDKTDEYEKVKAELEKLRKNNTTRIKGGEFKDRYHIVLLKFFAMCKLCGKLDFLKSQLDEKSPEYKTLCDIYDEKNLTNNTSGLEKILELIKEVDTEETKLYEAYEELREKRIMEIMSSVEIEQGDKFVCFTPQYSKDKSSLVIMPEYQQKMMKYLGIPEEEALIVHSNSDVVSELQDRKNLSRFRRVKGITQALISMNKINEGLHVGKVTR